MQENTNLISEPQGLLKQHHFLLRKIHSLTGLLPIGAFFMFHIYENAHIFLGETAWDEGTSWILRMPIIWFAEIFFIALPILFHAIYGIWIIWTGQPNLEVYNTRRNFMYYTQRVTGLIVLVFLLVHVFGTRIYGIVNDVDINADFVTGLFGSLPFLIFYIVGIISASIHFSNGLWNIAITWGFTLGNHSQRIWEAICWLIGIGFATLGVVVAIVFHLG